MLWSNAVFEYYSSSAKKPQDYLKTVDLSHCEDMVAPITLHGRENIIKLTVKQRDKVHVQYMSHPRQLIFLRRSDCFGCAVLPCLVVYLTLLASVFLPSHLSLTCIHVCGTLSYFKSHSALLQVLIILGVVGLHLGGGGGGGGSGKCSPDYHMLCMW